MEKKINQVSYCSCKISAYYFVFKFLKRNTPNTYLFRFVFLLIQHHLMICICILATKTIWLCLTPTSSGKQKRKTFELIRHWKSSRMIFQKWQNLENKVRTEVSLAEDLGLGNQEEKCCKPSCRGSKTKRDSASMCKCHSLFDG